jgi:hypothetical protein
MGARRLRECIYRVLPPYLKENAKATCYATLEKGEGDQPLPVRIAGAIERFQRIGISRERIEAKLGPIANLTAADLANLEVSFRSIRRTEVSADDEFPRVGTEEATAAARKLVDNSKGGGKAKPAEEPRQDTVTAENPAAAEGKGDEDRGEAHSGADDPLSLDDAKIEWTDATWNPVTGCSVVSPGCTNCYAMKLAGTRLQAHPSRAGLTKPSRRPGRSGPARCASTRKRLTQPLRWRDRA